LNLDQNVFDEGFADEALWTNKAQLVDVGMNWYMNKFVKIYFDWEHAIFADPVVNNPGQFEKSNDLFWVRTQVYF
jgi:phosphate-selective porin OprO/OprP